VAAQHREQAGVGDAPRADRAVAARRLVDRRRQPIAGEERERMDVAGMREHAGGVGGQVPQGSAASTIQILCGEVLG
jgi:hypothetical protein